MKTKKDKKVRVALGLRSYDVHIGAGLLTRLSPLLPKSSSKRAFIISDERLDDARKQLLSALKNAGWEATEFSMAAGERLKDFSRIYPLYGALLAARANRDSTLFALGGGSIGDAGGFIASTYLRGINWVGIPTTLLAQVDSCVGGKTGVNHEHGKNLIGTFHQPSLVVCDTHFLKTLSSREVISGLGEVIKYGLIFDIEFLNEVRDNWELALQLDTDLISHLIEKSLRWKAKVVTQDEFDLKGVREALNFGHTFGHALESVTSFKTFQHGEAVIWGMRFALALSRVRGKVSNRAYQAVLEFMNEIPVPPLPPKVSAETFFSHMTKDKKIRSGHLHFVLLNGIGKAFSDSKVSERDLRQAFTMIGGASYGR